MLLLKGALSGRDINELIEQCHPLGMFKESTMRSIPTFENSAKGYSDLYQTVLVDTPVGPYFAMFLQESAEHGDSRSVLEEVEIEIIKSSLIKYWLEDFYQFVEKLGGDGILIKDPCRHKRNQHHLEFLRHTFERTCYPTIGT